MEAQIMSDNKKLSQEEKLHLEKIESVKKQYGKAHQFFETFKPELQDKTAQHEDRVYFGTSPTLEIIALAYSENVLISWLIDQYEYFNSHCTVQQLNINQLEELARLTFLNASKLKVAEIQLFIFKTRSSVYGEFFGRVDIQRVLFFLQEFKNERRRILSDHYYIQKEEEKKLNRDKWKKEAVSRQDYESMLTSGKYKPKLSRNGK